MRVAVIGAGIVGLSCAHALLDEGHAVTLIDPGAQEGRACEGNAGWIAHTDILPLASAKAWRHVPRWLLDPLGPLAIRPAYLPRLAPWLARFLLASTPAAVAASAAAIRAINAEALPAWRRRLAGLGLSDHLRERGALSVWRSPAAFAASRPMLARQRALGIPVDELDGAGVRALEPALGAAVAAGALYPTVSHVSDPALLVRALADRARDRGAASVAARARAVEPTRTGADVLLDDGRRVAAERVVIAAGAWSRALAASVGDRVPLDTERGYNVTLAPGTLGLTRPIAYEGEGFVTTPLETGDRVGGAVEFGGLDAPANHARTDAILARLRRFLPDLPSASEGRRWMGFRPSLPDSLPVIGPSRASPHVVHAFGHAHHGLTQAAVTAELVAALVAGRRPAIELAPYAAQRFGGRGRAAPLPAGQEGSLSRTA
ncbi:MAG TPA: FAD-binding oxidoreductase [Salinarimonas sp.]|nr:FAD-binding oxidoreductase [Salinarimonas sp.]